MKRATAEAQSARARLKVKTFCRFLKALLNKMAHKVAKLITAAVLENASMAVW